MKRFITLLLLLSCVCMVACGGHTVTNDQNTPSPITPTRTPEENNKYIEAMKDMKNEYSDYINYREYLWKTNKKITEDKELKVLFFGGSLTAGHGASDKEVFSWRAKACDWFTKNFPDVNFEFINRAVGESGTFLGTYRLQLDVIEPAPDLIFLEYAINDKYFKSTYDETASRCETIIREVRNALPDTEIIVLITSDIGCFGVNKEGKLHAQGQAHEDIAAAYNISTLHIGRLIAKESGFSADVFRSDYAIDIVHPNDAGYAIYYNCVEEYLENSLKNTDFSKVEKKEPEKIPQICKSLFDGNRTHIQPTFELLESSEALGGSGVVFEERAYTANSYSNGVYKMSGTEDVFAFSFTGTEAAMWCTLKNKEYLISVDGAEYVVQTTTEHAPAVLVKNLESKEHVIKIKLADDGTSMTIGSIFTRDDSLATKK
ncbi:MAG: hypothetical protein IKJ75_05700 [Clostridia bacterium]|nr:hypothetical protein [Clostridia bacterium]